MNVLELKKHMPVAIPRWYHSEGMWRMGQTVAVYTTNKHFLKLKYQACVFRLFSNVLYIILLLFTAIRLSPGGSGYFTCKQNMKLVTTKFKSGGLREKHVVATWSVGNRLSVSL
jgi:hypothetical protein